MKVVIIGTGNVATVLGKKILTGGHEIIQVVGRNVEDAHKLGSILKCAVVYNIRYINTYGDIYIVAVSDSAIDIISSKLILSDKTVVHTAASVPKEVLKLSSQNYGVLYPLQSLKKEVDIIPAIPVLIDANNETTLELLKGFAEDWADSVQVANDEERLKLHVAAVFVSNFTNHLFTISNDFCEKEQLNFKLLYPLIEETMERIKAADPFTVQTGPAIRKDTRTIELHKHILTAYPRFEELYNVMTGSIIDFYEGRNYNTEKPESGA